MTEEELVKAIKKDSMLHRHMSSGLSLRRVKKDKEKEDSSLDDYAVCAVFAVILFIGYLLS